MKIAVICSNGRVGKLVAAEAVSRGWEVTGFARGENAAEVSHFVQKDLFALTKEDLAGFDAVVDAFGVWDADKLGLHTEVIRHLAPLFRGTGTRLLVVGGAGGLYLDASHTARLQDTAKDTPYYPLMLASTAAFEELAKEEEIEWTYVTPAAEFLADGEKRGRYTLCGEEFTTDAEGKSQISYADYALAMADEIEKGNHKKQRVSVRW